MTAGLYIHIPFCRKKCNYCDFYSLGGADFVPDEYVDAVLSEIRSYGDLVCRTVYFGGGTPSLLSPRQVSRILSELKIEAGAEITLEANPDTLTFEKLKGYYDAGVNRLSVGVQSVYDSSLENLGRIHTAQKAKEAFENAKKAGFVNISGDLMIGINNYSKKELFDTVDFLADCGCVHISAYMLKVEKGTPFYENRPENLADEDEMADYYLAACEKLKEKGYIQYEISNFCKAGYESRHNSIYWRLENYLGIGPRAHSCLDGKRFYYERDLKKFISGAEPIFDGEVDADDCIMLSLRLKEGLDLGVLAEKWGVVLPKTAYKKLELMKSAGLINFDGKTVSLTPKGFLVENGIAREIMMYN